MATTFRWCPVTGHQLSCREWRPSKCVLIERSPQKDCVGTKLGTCTHWQTHRRRGRICPHEVACEQGRHPSSASAADVSGRDEQEAASTGSSFGTRARYRVCGDCRGGGDGVGSGGGIRSAFRCHSCDQFRRERSGVDHEWHIAVVVDECHFALLQHHDDDHRNQQHHLEHEHRADGPDVTSFGPSGCLALGEFPVQ